MTRRIVTVLPPRVEGREFVVAWQEDPPSGLFERTSFVLRFPEGVAIAALPERIRWTAALLCLQATWPLLRPVVVRLPVTLPEGTGDAWRRLVASQAVTHDAYREDGAEQGTVTIVEEGPPIPAMAPRPDRGRAAAAFSGGKDSLLTAGLLAELSPRPVLVPTTSSRPPRLDHDHPRRRRAIEEIARRRDVDVVEVVSDARALWDNNLPRRAGYAIHTNEVLDTPLYSAALLLAGAASGATHLFLASENEVAETVERGGRVVQHPHVMYACATQRLIDRTLEGTGLRYGSLTWALHSRQVQELLWRRYADLRDLQHSCYRARTSEPACSGCSQCLRLALGALALDDDPGRLGVDLSRVLVAMRSYDPYAGARRPGEEGLPSHLTAQRLRASIVRAVAAVPPERVAARLSGAPRIRAWRARRAYARMRERFGRADLGENPGFRAGYLAFYDPLFADRVGAIFREHFPEEPRAAYEDGLERIRRVVDGP